jgi:hypothetical protein
MEHLLKRRRCRFLPFGEEEIPGPIEFGDDRGDLLGGRLGNPHQALLSRFRSKREREHRFGARVLGRDNHRARACHHAGQLHDRHFGNPQKHPFVVRSSHATAAKQELFCTGTPQHFPHLVLGCWVGGRLVVAQCGVGPSRRSQRTDTAAAAFIPTKWDE